MAQQAQALPIVAAGQHSDEHEGGREELLESLLTTSTLPTRERWWRPFFLFQGCCWLTSAAVRSNIAMHAEFQPRPDDVILATYPKCGTTWLKALAFAIANRSQHPVVLANGDDDDGHGHGHPLLTRSSHDLVPFLDLRPIAELESLPSPRILGTHLPLQLLPSGTAALGCRVVYLCREPKDVFVSTWHYMNKVHGESFHIELDKAFELFCEGVSIYGPIWENILGYWKLSGRRSSGSESDNCSKQQQQQVLLGGKQRTLADALTSTSNFQIRGAQVTLNKRRQRPHLKDEADDGSPSLPESGELEPVLF